MSTIELFRRGNSYSHIRVDADQANSVYWVRMHSGLRERLGRPCFTSELIDELLDFQQQLGERVKLERVRSPQAQITHMVLASDTNAFNLGGDLAFFVQCIRNGDRGSLMTYARECVRCADGFQTGSGVGVHTVALVQGDALGGGFEAALSCNTIVAESGVDMGLPEVLFDLFPGMGAFSLLSKRVAPQIAQKMMLNGIIYKSDELYEMGIVDVLVPKGQGIAAVDDVIRKNKRIPNAWAAMHQVRSLSEPVSVQEMMRITEIWVDTAMKLGEKPLRTMERLVKAQ